MTISSPSAETVRFIATILSARQTSIAELPSTIALLASTLQGLGAPAVAPAPAPVVAKPKRRARVAAPQRVAPQRAAPPVAAAPVVEVTVVPPVKRGRGRPRRVVVETPVVVEEPAIAVAPPQPKLLRRAQVSEPEPQIAEPTFATRPAGGAVRGVVKWYDPKAGKGVLRLTGISGDVAIDPAVLSRDGIKRLYKDQEIEATVEDKGGRVRLTGLSLPSRNAEPAASALGGSDIPAILRRPRQVLVEVKRDGSRRSAARAEAEQLLGSSGPSKITRRLNP